MTQTETKPWLVKDITSPNRRTEGEVGVEIELETSEPLGPFKQKGWRIEGDDSLRNFGYEFVMTKPTAKQKALDSVIALCDRINKEVPALLPDTPNGGIHVHVNCQDLTVLQTYNFMTLYWLFEHVLMEYCGTNNPALARKDNLFCMTLDNTENTLDNILGAMQSRNPFSIMENNVRYGSLNVAALLKYGSLEFRGMRSTLNHNVINAWINQLHHLKTIAKEPNTTPETIYDEFLSHYLDPMKTGLLLNKHITLSVRQGVPNAQQYLPNNVESLALFVYGKPDNRTWESFATTEVVKEEPYFNEGDIRPYRVGDRDMTRDEFLVFMRAEQNRLANPQPRRPRRVRAVPVQED